MRYVIIEIHPEGEIDSVILDIMKWFKALAGKEALGVEPRIVMRHGGRVIIQVPNRLLKYLRAAIVLAGRDREACVLTVRVSGTMRKAIAIAKSIPRIISSS